jgi:hypothetical protein
LQAWLKAATIRRGPVFRAIDRHGNVGKKPMTRWGVIHVVRRAASAGGLDPPLYGSHSLRAGLATSAGL